MLVLRYYETKNTIRWSIDARDWTQRYGRGQETGFHQPANGQDDS